VVHYNNQQLWPFNWLVKDILIRLQLKWVVIQCGRTARERNMISPIQICKYTLYYTIESKAKQKKPQRQTSLWTNSNPSHAAWVLDWFNNSPSLKSSLTGKENRTDVIFFNFSNTYGCIIFWLRHHKPKFKWFSGGLNLADNGTIKCLTGKSPSAAVHGEYFQVHFIVVRPVNKLMLFNVFMS